MSTKEDKKRITPEAFQAIKLDEIAERLGDLTEIQGKVLQHLKETTPEGIDFPIDTVAVTTAQLVNFLKSYPYRKLRSIDFYNKGTDTVYIRINEDAKEVPLEAQEQITLTRPRAIIEYLTLRVDSGTSATLRMVGHT